MSKTSNKTSVKSLMVRSITPRRGRSGYTFSPEFQHVDVQKDELTQEDVDAIMNDPDLVAIESERPKTGRNSEVATAVRRKNDGSAWQPGQIAIGNSTLETATEEMNRAALRGEQPRPHPSGPGGQTQTGEMHPDAVQANVDRLEQQNPNNVQPTGRQVAAPKPTSGKKRGRPSKAAGKKAGDRVATKAAEKISPEPARSTDVE